MSTTLWNMEFIGEVSDTSPTPTRDNTVIRDEFDYFHSARNAHFMNWKMCIIFPDEEKAKYFLTHFKNGMNDFREGMLKDDYIFHVIHFRYDPKPDSLYADQMNMTKNYKYEHGY
jgi:hypothetical protein